MKRIVLVVGLLALFAQPALFGADAKQEEVTLEEQRLREIVGLKIGFHPFVFDHDVFPKFHFEDEEEAESLIGGKGAALAFFDRDGKKVEAPEKSGCYLARVGLLEVTKDHRDLGRLFTLFKIAAPVDANWKFTKEAANELAVWAGIDPDIVAAQHTLIAETLKDRTFDQFKNDSRVARLFAGLSLSDAKTTSVRRNSDAFARERQWVVTLKRSFNGSDKAFAKAVNAPEPLVSPALTVR